MISFVVLTATFALRTIGAVGIVGLKSWTLCLRGRLFAMFLLTASAHWGKRRSDLIRMVPSSFPRPGILVTTTGLLEILGAIGLLIPMPARAASICLVLLLIAMFPANVRAARENLTIAGQPATPLPLRALLQVAFIAALGTAGFGNL